MCLFFTFCWSCIMQWFLVNDQCDAQILFMYLFLNVYMFRAHRAHHQERQIVSIQPLVTVILCWWPRCVQVGRRLLPTCTNQDKFGSCTRKTLDRFTTKDSYTWNIAHNTESTAVWSLKPEHGGYRWFKRSTRKKKPVTRDDDNNNNNNNNDNNNNNNICSIHNLTVN